MTCELHFKAEQFHRGRAIFWAKMYPFTEFSEIYFLALVWVNFCKVTLKGGDY